MASKSKKLKGLESPHSKKITSNSASTDGEKMIWIFDAVDVDGIFRFDPHRADFDAVDVFDKLLNYSKRTWREIRSETHDHGKSKHHFLDGDLSVEAEERIARLHLESDRDRIFSLRLENRTRIIGIRDGAKFIVKWFDPNHQFCPSTRK